MTLEPVEPQNLTEALRSAVLSILDVLDEIAQVVSDDPRWADVVTDTFNKHRTQIRDLN